MGDLKSTGSNIKAHNQARYGRVADGYVQSVVHATGADLDLLFQMADPQPNYLALDVATGGGHTALKLAPFVRRMVVTDLTPNMLRAARNHLTEKDIQNALYSHADAENLPFPAETFDLVTCRIAAHHFPDVFKFMQAAYRVLKPGGTLAVQDQVMPPDARDADYVNAYEKLRDPSHVRSLPEHDWRGVFLDAGFTLERVEKVFKRQDFMKWARLQNCDDATIERLQVMLLRAPAGAAAWMDAAYPGTEAAQFSIHHILLKGRKPRT